MFRCWAELQTLVVKDSPSREDYVGAIEVLRWAERIVVTGEALSQRLLGRHTLMQRLLQSCIVGSDSGSGSPNKQHASGRLGAGGTQYGSAGLAQHDLGPARQLDGEAETQHLQPSGVHTGTALSAKADIAFVCGLLDRQQQQDIQKTAASLEDSQKAAGPKDIPTIDWDPPLQTTRVLDCESTENALAQGRTQIWDPRLGHRLFARTLPGELRLATVLITEQ